MLRFADGTLRRYHAFGGSNVEGALAMDEDPDGNRISYLYDHQGLLTTIVDQLGRSHALAYDAAGRVVSETSFDGARRASRTTPGVTVSRCARRWSSAPRTATTSRPARPPATPTPSASRARVEPQPACDHGAEPGLRDAARGHLPVRDRQRHGELRPRHEPRARKPRRRAAGRRHAHLRIRAPEPGRIRRTRAFRGGGPP